MRRVDMKPENVQVSKKYSVPLGEESRLSLQETVLKGKVFDDDECFPNNTKEKVPKKNIIVRDTFIFKVIVIL